MKAELMVNNHDDLTVVNTARISFNKCKDKLDKKDHNLINYLIKHMHGTTLRHSRFTFKLDRVVFNLHVLPLLLENQFLMAGAVFHKADKTVYMRHSFLGWLNLAPELPNWLASGIMLNITKAMPVAVGFGYGEITQNCCLQDVADKLLVPEDVQLPKRFTDVTLRITAPLTVMAHFVKHQVGFTLNSVSRRYVDDCPVFHDQEFRVRAENAKQGSGEVTDYVPTVQVGNHHLTIQDLTKLSTDWYNEAVDKDGEYKIAPETARGYLQQNMETTWVWTGNLDSWRNMLGQRLGHGVLKETEQLAKDIKVLLEKTICLEIQQMG